MLMKKNGNIRGMLFNAFKISVGCVAAIALSALIGLNYSVTAGLITVLSIQDTKKETAVTALKRLLAFIAAAVISSVCFIFMGCGTIAFLFCRCGCSGGIAGCRILKFGSCFCFVCSICQIKGKSVFTGC